MQLKSVEIGPDASTLTVKMDTAAPGLAQACISVSTRGAEMVLAVSIAQTEIVPKPTNRGHISRTERGHGETSTIQTGPNKKRSGRRDAGLIPPAATGNAGMDTGDRGQSQMCNYALTNSLGACLILSVRMRAVTRRIRLLGTMAVLYCIQATIIMAVGGRAEVEVIEMMEQSVEGVVGGEVITEEDEEVTGEVVETEEAEIGKLFRVMAEGEGIIEGDNDLAVVGTGATDMIIPEVQVILWLYPGFVVSDILAFDLLSCTFVLQNHDILGNRPLDLPGDSDHLKWISDMIWKLTLSRHPSMSFHILLERFFTHVRKRVLVQIFGPSNFHR